MADLAGWQTWLDGGLCFMLGLLVAADAAAISLFGSCYLYISFIMHSFMVFILYYALTCRARLRISWNPWLFEWIWFVDCLDQKGR